MSKVIMVRMPPEWREESLKLLSRGQAKLQAGRKEGAYLDWDRALALWPGNTEAATALAHLFLEQGDFWSAVELHERGPEVSASLGKALRADPRFFRHYEQLGNDRKSAKDYPGAIAAYDRALECEPDNTSTLWDRGWTLMELEDWRRAHADFLKIVEHKPEDGNAWYNLAKCRRCLDDLKGALFGYDKAAAILTEDAPTFNSRGCVRYDLQLFKEAQADFSRAIELDGTRALYYANRARAENALNDKKAALGDYDRAVALDTGYHVAYYNRGLIRRDWGEWAEALKDFEKALACLPDDPESLMMIGRMKERLGELPGALASLDLCISRRRDLTGAWFSRLWVKRRLGDFAGGLADCDELAKVSTDATIEYYRGLFLSDLGRLDDALAAFGVFIQKAPKDGDGYFRRALVRCRKGDAAGAYDDASSALGLYEQSSDPWAVWEYPRAKLVAAWGHHRAGKFGGFAGKTMRELKGRYPDLVTGMMTEADLAELSKDASFVALAA